MWGSCDFRCGEEEVAQLMRCFFCKESATMVLVHSGAPPQLRQRGFLLCEACGLRKMVNEPLFHRYEIGSDAWNKSVAQRVTNELLLE